ncbi:hypothetical protein D3C80_1754290 [compost metagenome]
MHDAGPGRVRNRKAFERTVEHPVEHHVPAQGQGGNEDGHHAHFQHGFVHDPRQQRRTNEDSQQFEADGLENSFGDGFVGAHGLTP